MHNEKFRHDCNLVLPIQWRTVTWRAANLKGGRDHNEQIIKHNALANINQEVVSRSKDMILQL